MNNAMADDQAVFEELRKLPPGSERDARLQQRCGNDGEMRHRIATPLCSYDQARSFLEVPPPELEPETMAIAVAVTAEKPRDEWPSRTLGHYQVLEMVGEGGMGRVVKGRLGSVLYAMCVGKAPFRAPSTVATLREVCDKRPEPIRALNPKIPKWLVHVIDKLHAKDPNDRFRSAGEVANVLGAALAELQQPGLGRRQHLLKKLLAGDGRHIASRRFSPIAGAVLLVLIAFEIGEATGVTRILSSAFRVASGEGELVIKGGDPEMRVRIKETGAVVRADETQELRLRAGSYTVLTTKNGQDVQEVVLMIRRGEREVLDLGREVPSNTAAAQAIAVPLAKDAIIAKEAGRLEGQMTPQAIGASCNQAVIP